MEYRLAFPLIISFLSILAIPNIGHGKHYNSIKLSCDITGSEVSLTPINQPGPRIQTRPYSEKINYQIDQIVYVSDRAPSIEQPLSFVTATNESDFPIDQFNIEESYDSSIFDLFYDPAQIFIIGPSAQTTVRLEFSRDQLIELFVALGSTTARIFRGATELEFSKVEFTKSRYYTSPQLWKDAKVIAPTTTLDFTGWYGLRRLETCYQFDPVDFHAPDDADFYGLAYHICGSCHVEILESSSALFEPVMNTFDPK